ncbi:MAG: hypothetical protein V2I27_02410 [Erythrobacter sp.]|jgi:hypothetical protein|nr:hypothetical protein [Erythrobacter sp.]
MAEKTPPIRGPFPDGDSRNITLVKSSNPMEPARTGPQEPDHREEGAPETVMGDLADTEMKDGAASVEPNTTPEQRASQGTKLGSRGADGAMPQEDPQAGEPVDPAIRARADAKRPITGA